MGNLLINCNVCCLSCVWPRLNIADRNLVSIVPLRAQGHEGGGDAQAASHRNSRARVIDCGGCRMARPWSASGRRRGCTRNARVAHLRQHRNGALIIVRGMLRDTNLKDNDGLCQPPAADDIVHPHKRQSVEAYKTLRAAHRDIKGASIIQL